MYPDKYTCPDYGSDYGPDEMTNIKEPVQTRDNKKSKYSRMRRYIKFSKKQKFFMNQIYKITKHPENYEDLIPYLVSLGYKNQKPIKKSHVVSYFKNRRNRGYICKKK